MKVRVPAGESVYAIPEYEPDRIAPEDQLRRVMAEWVAEVAHSGPLVVLRTPPGCAHVVASALDRSGLAGPARHRGRRRHHAVRGRGGRRRRPAGRAAPGPGRPGRVAPRARVTPSEDAEPAAPAATGATLWHGRFAGGPAEELLAYTASLPFDRRLWPQDVARFAGPRPRVWAGPGCSTEAEVAAVARRARAGGGRAGRGHVRLRPDRRGHPHGHRATGDRARRSGRRQPPHRPQPQRPGGHRPAPVVQGRATGRRRRASSASSRCCSSGPAPPASAYLPGLHPPAAGPARAAGPPPAGPRVGAGPRRRPPAGDRRPASTCRRSAPARSPARRCRSTRRATAADLGFAGVFDNSLDAVSDRDFVAEALFDLTLVAIHLSRMGEEWVLWTSDEFGFARLDDGYATGSSMMPQKKNPDIAELARGKAGRVDRRPDRAAGHAEGPAARLQPRPAGGQGAAVRRGRPGPPGPRRTGGNGRNGNVRARPDAGRGRRAGRWPPPTWPSGWSSGGCPSGTPTPSSARSCAGRWTARATSRDLVAAHPDLGPDAAALVGPGMAVRRRTTPGGGGPGPVAVQLEQFAAALDDLRARLPA